VSIWLRPVACPDDSAAGTPKLAPPAPPSPAKGWIAMIEICLGCFV
jgi:hypothetical protein